MSDKKTSTVIKYLEIYISDEQYENIKSLFKRNLLIYNLYSKYIHL